VLKKIFHSLIKSKQVKVLKAGCVRLWRWIRKRKIWLFLTLFLILLIFVIGYFEGLQQANEKMQVFPDIYPGMRLLVVSPHPDDEILMAGGLIQKILKADGEVKVVFMTSGDGSRDTVNRENLSPDYSAEEYIGIGKTRMQEAVATDTRLGIPLKDIVFLGFPDGGLKDTYYKHFSISDGVYTSQTTKTNSVPYDQAYQFGQQYLGKYLVKDLEDIIQEFKPNIVVTTSPNDTHPDHNTSFFAVQRAKEGLDANWPIFTAIVHYYNYPPKSGNLVPPKKIFSTSWYSLQLTSGERQIKIDAGKKYTSQYANSLDRNLFVNLSAKNEIFEKK
jgi:LmbE family N-acetylglucosaminyl deacetylase